MGIFDNVKSRLGMGNAADDNYVDNYDNQYVDDNEYYYEDEDVTQDQYRYPAEEQYQEPRLGARRSGYGLDEHPPLISMTDVRSQELPPLDLPRSNARANLRSVGANTQNTSNLNRVQQSTNFPLYEIADTTPDPLLQRHSLSNTGNFDSTSPAYYASRSGVGRVRGSDEASGNRKQGFRETVVIRPQNYAEAEQIALNLKQGNAVAVVLTNTRPELAKRILDFGFGAAAALEGQVDSPANRIYVFTLDYGLTDQELELLQARGVL